MRARIALLQIALTLAGVLEFEIPRLDLARLRLSIRHLRHSQVAGMRANLLSAFMANRAYLWHARLNICNRPTNLAKKKTHIIDNADRLYSALRRSKLELHWSKRYRAVIIGILVTLKATSARRSTDALTTFSGVPKSPPRLIEDAVYRGTLSPQEKKKH